MGSSLTQLLRRLSLGHAVPPLAVLLEVLWAYAWLEWISTWQAVGWSRPPMNMVEAVALAAMVEVVTRFALARAWQLKWIRLAVLSTSAILLATVAHLETGGGYALWDAQWIVYASKNIPFLLGGLGFGVYLLWRGISLGRETLSLDDLYQRFLIGLAALVMLLILRGIVSALGESRTVPASAGIYVIAYFAIGLLGLALINLRDMRNEMLRHKEASALLSRRWLTLILAVILAILAVAMGLASVFSLDLLALLLNPLNTLANWLLIAFLYGIGYPLGFLAAGLIYILRFLIRLLGGGQPPQPFQPPGPSDFQKLIEGQEARGIPPEVVVALKWGLVTLVAALVAFLLARALFRYWRAKPDEEIEEISESLWSWSEFKGDLLSLLASLLHWLLRRRHGKPVLIPSPAVASLQDDDLSRLFTVRELYQGLLWEGHQAGLPRRPASTPYEYEGTLESRLGTEMQELEAITEAYVAERYGPTQTEAEHLVLLNHWWRRLRSLIRGEQSARAEEQGKT